MKKIIAHRGAPTLAHENTLDSFLKAWQLGADFIEFDVRRTKDNLLIAHHDPFIMHNSAKINISDLTYIELTIITSEHNYQVPQVKEILHTFCGKVGLDIELKEGNCEQEVLQMISDLPVKPRFFFTSFNPAILRKLKNTDSSLQTGLLFESIETVINDKNEGIDFFCPDFATYFSYRDFFGNSTSMLSPAVWTVNTSEEIRKVLKDPLIGAVITNETELAVSIRNEIYGNKLNHINQP